MSGRESLPLTISTVTVAVLLENIRLSVVMLSAESRSVVTLLNTTSSGKLPSTSDNWTVFRLPAMLRPTWTDEERALKEKQYGRADSCGFKNFGPIGVSWCKLLEEKSNDD